MVRIFVRHAVADYAAWREVYDEFDAERGPMGVVAHGVCQGLDDPNDVTLWHDFATREQAEAFTASEALRDAMRRAGVQGQPAVWLVREAPSGPSHSD
jgi:hypothetical protein